MKPSISEHNRTAYVEALDAILLARSDVLDADATFDSIMLLREDLAGVPFQYPTAPSDPDPRPNMGYLASATYFLNTTKDGSVMFQWTVDQTTIKLKLKPDRAARLGGDLKGFADYLLSFQKDGGS